MLMAKTSIKDKEASNLKDKAAFFIAFVIILILLNIISKGRYLTISNIKSLITQSVVPTFIAWGMCFIFTTGVMDLSIGAIMILASNMGGTLAVSLGFGYPGLIIGSIITAVLLQTINLTLFTNAKIPSWVAGLGMAMIYESIGSIYSSHMISLGKQAVDLGNKCRALGASPVNIIVWIAGLIIAYVIFNRTSAGLNIRAIGGNEEVSKMMGINIKKTLIISGIIGGAFLGLASAINESYSGRIMPVTGLSSISSIFISLAILFLAKSFESKVNLTIGVLFSAFLISSLFNVLTILGVPSGTWQEVCLGISIIFFGILSQRGNKGVSK